MPQTRVSRNDNVVGQTIPSTTVDPSKGTGTTRAASSYNTSNAGNTSGKVVIVRPPPKFGVRKLVVVRASS